MTFFAIRCTAGCMIGDQSVVVGQQYEVKRSTRKECTPGGVFLFFYYEEA
jgi:hypothetical protein